MKQVLILIKSKEKLGWVHTTSDILKRCIEEDKNYQVTRDYIGNVNYHFDSKHKIWRGYIRDKKLESFDLVHLQTAGALRDQATLLTHYCIQKGIRYTEGSFKSTLSNSKLIQVMKLFQKGIRTPNTLYLGGWLPQEVKIKYPLVAKRMLGKGGEGVFLIKNKAGLTALAKKGDLENYLFQEFIPNDFDWRIVVIDKQAVYSRKRVRQDKKEFRNNVKLGAQEVVAKSPIAMNRVALAAARAMNLTIAGIDIIDKDGTYYVIEVNRSPSFTTDIKFSDEIPKMAEYIKKCLN